MTDQETAHLAAIAGQARSPDSGGDYYKNLFGPKLPGNVDDDPAISKGHPYYPHEVSRKTNLDSTTHFPRGKSAKKRIGDTEIKKRSGQAAFKKSEDGSLNVARSPMKLSIAKSNSTTKDMKLRTHNEGVNNKAGLYISRDVFDKLTESSDSSVKMAVKQQNRPRTAKATTKGIRTSGSLTKQSSAPSKKVIRSSLRRLLKSPSPILRSQKSPSVRHTPSSKSNHVSLFRLSASDNARFAVSEKAENNNRSANKDDLDSFQSGVVVPTTHAVSRASALPTLMASVDEDCDDDVVIEKSGTGKGMRVVADPTAKKDLSFSRADSSDDSGCFSNLSRQSTNLHGEGYTPTEQLVSKDAFPNPFNSEMSKDAKKIPSSPSVCNACGNEVQSRCAGYCKNCMNRIKKENDQKGTLEEFRAYAQSIAQSVKKILTINPQRGKSEAILRDEPKKSTENQDVKQAREAFKKGHPEAVLHRYKTEMPMTHPDELRAKSLLNRSMSFDSNIIVGSDGNDIKSPTYWGGHELNRKVSNSSTTLFDPKMADDDPLRKLVIKRSDQSSGDIKGSNRMLFAGDENKFGRAEKVEKLKKKIIRSKGMGKYERGKLLVDSVSTEYMSNVVVNTSSETRPPLPPAAWRSDDEFKTLVPSSYNSKHRSRVERAKTDGDLRPNILQHDVQNKSFGKSELKRIDEVCRSGSKTFRKPVSEVDEDGKFANKYDKDKINSLKISRLKVMKEGSPVDPPFSAVKNRADDSKARRTALIRSATAPYKHNVPKRDGFPADKATSSESTIKANKTIGKPLTRSNKASSLRKESSMKEKERPALPVAVPTSDTWKEDASKASSIKPAPKRRSTSCDGNMAHTKRVDVQRSKSRSALNYDEGDGRLKRESMPGTPNFRRNIKDNEGTNFTSSPKTAVKLRENNDSFVNPGKATDGPHRMEMLLGDAVRRGSSEHAGSEIFFDQIKQGDGVTDFTASKNLKELEDAHGKSPYYDAPIYYSNEVKKQLSPLLENETAAETQKEIKPANNDACYFCYADAPAANSPALTKNITKAAQPAPDSLFPACPDDEIYHDQFDKYIERREAPEEPDALWYTPIPDLCPGAHALVPRDRSHESKSSTSFHVMANVKSSHSDVALMKHQSAIEHVTSRKQSLYSESDVDTGVIYHFAKRQTTRAHVPPYHELTAPKGIYTMSGDVSTSESSNSAVSLKSELSDSLYTGGFFKSDPFYDNDTKGNFSSESSTSHIYFEPEGVTKQEPSENDIYTGGVFSSSQNALTLGGQADTDTTNQSYGAMEDGSTNNSTRLPQGRMSRRFRYHRPRIDAIGVRSAGSVGDFTSKSAVPIDGFQFSNCSNNSNYWIDLKGLEQSGINCPRTAVTLSDESLYTDYEPGTRPEFQVAQQEKYVAGPDFSKYEICEASANAGFFFSSPPKVSVREDEWYRGPFDRNLSVTDGPPCSRANRPQNVTKFLMHDEDDDYTNVCPKRRDANNCNDTEWTSHNCNNNHFEECYTGSYGATNTTPYLYGQPNTPRSAATSSMYEQATSQYSSSNFYDPGYTGNQASPTVYEQVGATYAASTVCAAASPVYSQSKTYLYEQINESASQWGEYDPKPSSSSSNLYEDEYMNQPQQKQPRSEDKDSYFQYISSRSPGKCVFVDEESSYLGEPKRTIKVDTSPLIQEIKRVGGIVCRENVANKEDYAEDVNRDLEPSAWVPFNYRRGDEELKHPAEMSGGRSTKSEVFGAADISSPDRYSMKHNMEDSAYAHNRIYDNLGARNKWREMAGRREPEIQVNRSVPHNRLSQSMGDPPSSISKKSEYPSKSAWMPPDQIPERARGKRVTTTAPPPGPTLLETNNANENSKGNSE